MSIVDKIYEVEEKVKQLRMIGEKDVLSIKDDISLKKNKMQEFFSQELVEKKEILEKEMSQRVEEYRQNIFQNNNSENNLQHIFEQKKSDIFVQVCKYFWKE